MTRTEWIRTRCALFILAGLTSILMTMTSSGQTRRDAQSGYAASPCFADFPAPDRFECNPATVSLLTKHARVYRTMLRDSAKDGPTFAGHYTIGQWGWGAGCVQFAIIDAKTGNVYFPPFYVSIVAGPEEKMDQIPEPLQFKRDSKLLIVTGARNEKGGGEYYYKWANNKLPLIN